MSVQVSTFDGMAKPQPSEEGKVPVQARVDPTNLARFDELAKERRWSRSQLIDFLIEQFVKENDGKKSKER